MGSLSQTRLSDFTFTFHFHALEEEMEAHSSVLAWRIPGTAGHGPLNATLLPAPVMFGLIEGRAPSGILPAGAACLGKHGSERTKQIAPSSPLTVAIHSVKLVTAALGMWGVAGRD